MFPVRDAFYLSESAHVFILDYYVLADYRESRVLIAFFLVRNFSRFSTEFFILSSQWTIDIILRQLTISCQPPVKAL